MIRRESVDCRPQFTRARSLLIAVLWVWRLGQGLCRQHDLAQLGARFPPQPIDDAPPRDRGEPGTVWTRAIVSVPDRVDGWLWLPLPALAAWASTIGYGCFADWVSVGPEGLRWGETARCFATVLLTSVPLGLALAVGVRDAALLRARAVAATGGLAVAALTAAALSLLHPIDATAMILIWNAGIVALITGFATVFGRTVLRWTALRFATTRTLPEGAVQ